MRKLPVRIEPRAKRELEGIVRWYAVRSEKASRLFEDQVSRSLDQITRFPLSAPASELGRRRIRVRGFPIKLDYRFGKEQIEIISVTHDRQKPEDP